MLWLVKMIQEKPPVPGKAFTRRRSDSEATKTREEHVQKLKNYELRQQLLDEELQLLQNGDTNNDEGALSKYSGFFNLCQSLIAWPCKYSVPTLHGKSWNSNSVMES